MRKKLSLLLCLVCAVVMCAACGGDPVTEDYYGMDYATLESVAVNNIAYLSTLSESDMETLAASVTDDLSVKLVTGWRNTTADIGAYQKLGELVVTKANGTVTVDQYVDFEERSIDVTFVWEYNYADKALEITDISVDLVYTMGETMGKAALNTLMGMGTVFTVLILISLIIYCFRFIPGSGAYKKKEAPKEAAVAAVPVAEEPVAEETDDLELVAVIAAAIAADTGTTTDSFVVRSIRRR